MRMHSVDTVRRWLFLREFVDCFDLQDASSYDPRDPFLWIEQVSSSLQCPQVPVDFEGPLHHTLVHPWSLPQEMML